MSEAEDVKVNARFAQWYKAVDLGDNDGRVIARWEGILEAYESVNSKTILPICQLAFGGPRPSAEALAWFEQSFKKFDESFAIASNDSELRILAAACIVNELEDATHPQAEICLTIAASCFSGLRKFAVPFEIQKMVDATLHRLSTEAATRPTRAPLDPKPLSFKSDVLQHWSSNPEAALKSMTESFNAKLTPLRGKIEALSTIIDVQDDELQVLWWLFGGRSLERKSPFAKVPSEIRPFIFAKELADCIKIAPGPASIPEIFAKVGVSGTGKQNLISAIEAVSDWGATIAHEKVNPSPWFHPLHYALTLQMQAENNWQQFWAGSVKIDLNTELTPLTLAQQFYRERLQLRSA